MSKAPFIRFTDVTKVFPRPDGKGTFAAVDRLSFEIEQGEVVAVLGKTGCGKSTMFNLLAGLIEPSSGEVSVTGHAPFEEFNYFRGKIGIVFQNDRLMPWRSALDNVMLGLQILDKDKAEAEAIARRWLARLGLSGHEMTIRMRCPAACASASPSRGPLRSSRTSCCAMSRSRRSTR